MKHDFKFTGFEFHVNHYMCKRCDKTIVALSPSDYSEQVKLAGKCKPKKRK